MVGPAESVVLSGVCHHFMVAPAQTVLYSPVSAIVSWLLQLRQCCTLWCLPLFHGCSSSDSVVLSGVCHCFMVAPAQCYTLLCLPLFHGCSSSDSVVLSCVCHCFMVAPAQTVLSSPVSAIVSWLLQLRQCCPLQCLPLFHSCSSSLWYSPVSAIVSWLVQLRVLYSPVSAIISWLLQLRQCCTLWCLSLFHGCSSSDSVVLSSVCHCFIVAPDHCCTLQCLPLFHGWSS